MRATAANFGLHAGNMKFNTQDKSSIIRRIIIRIILLQGPSSVVGIATGYELDGPGIKSR
jgi:hypothetical protein